MLLLDLPFLNLMQSAKADTINPDNWVTIPIKADPMLQGLSIPANAASQGMWSGIKNWPIVTIHSAVMPDGRVLTYGTPTDDGDIQDTRTFDLWDPVLGFGAISHQTTFREQQQNSFCSTSTFLSNGDLLVSGGNDAQTSTIFNPISNEVILSSNNLADDRWYSTMITLPDGRPIILGGMHPYSEAMEDEPDLAIAAGEASMTPEVLETTGWRSLITANSRDAFGPDFLRTSYPHAWVAPNGQVFGISSDKMWFLDPNGNNGNGTITTAGNFKTPYTKDPNTLPAATVNSGTTATAVMYAPGKIIQVGGNSGFGVDDLPGTNKATVVDINSGTPVLTEQPTMANARRLSNGIVLANGEVVITGGSALGNGGGANALYATEIWTPNSANTSIGTWRTAASAAVYRGYHSNTALLPNGTILSTGGGAPGPVANFNAEIYYPPYLFKSVSGTSQLAVRPVIKAISGLSYANNADMQLDMGNSNTISQLSLVGLSQGTHAFNTGQRRIPLTFTQESIRLTTTLPNANLAPPGYYQVVALDADGVPSLGAVIAIGQGQTPPQVPTDPYTPPDLSGNLNVPVINAGGTANYSVTAVPGVTYSWNFGDGTADTPYSSNPAVTHTYTQAGLYLVTLSAKDSANIITTRTFLQAVATAKTTNSPSNSTPIAFETRAGNSSRVWVVNPDNDSVSVIDDTSKALLATINVGTSPRTLAVAADGRIWVVNKESATISIISPSTLAVVQTIALPRASQPHGIAFAPAGGSAYVALEATGQLVKLNPSTGAQQGIVSVGSNPRHLSITADATKVLVSRFITPPLPGESTATVNVTSSSNVGGEVVVVNPTNMSITQTVILHHSDKSDSPTQGSGVPNYLAAPVISPDGTTAWVPSKQDNIKRGTLRSGQNLDFQNTVRAISSRIDMATLDEDYAKRIDHDNSSVGSAAVYHPSGVYMFVALETSRQVAVVDAIRGTELFRINLGRAPQGLTISPDGNTLYVQEFMDRGVSVFDLTPLTTQGLLAANQTQVIFTVASEKLPAQVVLGKQLFYDAKDARLARDSYMSCASCHNDAGSDGRVWDLTGFGEGLRNTIALKGRAAMDHGNLHWSANFDELQDFEGQIRTLSGGTGLMTNTQFNTGTRNQPLGDKKAGLSVSLDDLAAYVASLNTFAQSPNRNTDGTLTTAATAGKAVFANSCSSCHGGANFTTSSDGANLKNIGTMNALSGQRLNAALTGIDVPTLRDVWATAPYLHNGSATTVTAAVQAHNNLALNATDLANVVAYVQQIGGEEFVAGTSSGHWKFDEASGNTVADGSGNARPLTLTNVTRVAGRSGQAGQFNGSNSSGSTTVPVINTAQSFSVSAWVKLSDLFEWRTIASQDGVSISGFFLQYSRVLGNKFAFSMPATDSSAVASIRALSIESPVEDQWYHLVGVRDVAAGNIKLYVNGVLQATTPYTGAWSANGTFNVGRGKWGGGPVDFFGGTIDEVSTYNYPITSVEVAQLYSAASASNVAPTVAITAPTSGTAITRGATVAITATAADSDGTVARVEFYDGATLLGTDTTAPYAFSWETSTATATGAHSLTARAYDNVGAVTTSAAVSVTVNAPANVAPTVSLTAPTANAVFTQGTAITVSATAADSDGTVAQVQFFDGTTLLGTDTAAPYTFSWATTTATATGAHSLTAVATDNTGATTTSAAVSVTVNAPANVAPTVSLTAPTANAVFTQGTAITVSATAADSDGTVAQVQFFDGTTLIGTATAAPYTVTLNNAALGAHTLTAVATDNTGATTTSAVVSVTVNAPANVAPTVSLTAPTANAVFTQGTAITVSATAADSDGTVAQVQFFDGTTLIGTATAAPYTVTLNNAALGAHTLTAVATDNTGATTTSAAVSVTVNAPANVAPTVSLTAPTANAVFTQGTAITVSATAADSDGTVAQVQFFDGTTLIGTATAAPYTVTLNNAALGAHTLTAVATDNTGATTTSAAVSVTVNAPANVAPTVSLTAPTANAVFTQGTAITVSATAADSDGTVAQVQFFDGTTLIGTATAAPYTVTLNNAALGAHTLTAVATDNTGATTTSAAVSVTVNAPANVAPTVSLTAPTANAVFTQGTAITVSATAADSDGTVAQVQFFDGTTLIGTATAAPYTVTLNNAALGAHTLTAVATDNTGATTTSAAVSVTVNAPANVAPTVSLTAPTANAVFTQGTAITVSATAADSDGTVAQVQFFDGTTLIGTATAAPYTVTLNNAALGAHTLTAVATDNTGATTTSAAVSVTVNAPANVAPTVSLTAPTANAVFTQGTAITVSATAADSDGTVAQVQFFDGTTLIGTATAAPYTVTLNNAALGAHTLTAVATDNTGATTTSAAVSVTVNAPANVAPTVSLTAPTANAVFTQGTAITVSATAADSDGTVAQVQFFDGTTLIGTATAAPYTVTLNNAALGAHTLTAVATDNTGATTTSAAVSVTVNAPANVAPTVSLTAPTANAVFTQGTAITVSATAADSDGTVAQVQFFDGTTLLGTDTAAPYTFSWATTTATATGAHSLTAVATDNTGATTTSAAVSVTVNAPANVAPTVSLTAPTANAVFTQGTAITVSATAADSDGTVAQVQFFDGTTLIGTATAAPYTVTLNNAALGAHTLTAVATDNTGATTTSAVVSVTVNAPANVAPTVSLTAPTANAVFTQGTAITVSATAADSDGTVAQVQFFDGTTLIGTATAAPYTVTLNNAALGAHTLTAVATDNTGATTTSAVVSVTVNAPANVAPTVSLTAPTANAVFTQGTAITVSATAADSDGTVAQVQFFDGTTLLGTDTAAPYTFSWATTTATATGAHSLTAVATDNTGATTTSAAVSVTVNAPGSIVSSGDWKFDEASGNTVADGSGNARPLTLTNVTRVAGRSGQAGQFNGSNSSGSTTVPVINTAQSFSVSAWVNLSSLTGWRTIASQDGVSISGFFLQYSQSLGNKFAFSMPATDSSAVASIRALSTGSPVAGQWYHLVGVRDVAAGNIKLYVNGVLQATTPYTGAWSANGTFNVGRGKWGGGPVDFFGGTIDEVSTYNYPITTGEVTQLYNAASANNVAPTVSLTAPTANAVFTQGAAITVSATAADSDGTVAQVQFFDGTTLIGTDTTAPYTFSWATTTATATGAHSLTAVATDNTGATTTSAAVSVTVNASPANVAPTVAMTAPVLGSTITRGTTIALAATAADSDGTVAQVQFFDGTTLLGTDTAAPYTFSWATTTATATGAHTLTAVATDNTGATTTSAAVSVTVNAPANVAPTVSLTAPTANAVFTQGTAITVSATAADSDGTVAQVQFYDGTTLLGTDTAAPYTFSWATTTATATGAHSLTAVATDNIGATTTSAAVSVTVNAPGSIVSSGDWKFDEASGNTVADGSGNARPLTLTNVTRVAGRSGQAGQFNGSNSSGSTTVPVINTAQSFSVSAWVNLSSLTGWRTIASQDGVSISGFFLQYSQSLGNKFAFSMPATDSSAVASIRALSTGSPVAGQWYHLVGVRDVAAGNIKLYVNGVLQATTPYTGAWSANGTFNVGRGKWGGGPVDFFGGTIDEVSTYNYPITTGEVTQLYNAASANNVAPTVSLTAPTANAVFTQGTAITVSATAADTDGTVARVEFYDGATLLGTDTTTPYAFSWVTTTATTAGAHSLTARAYDNVGAVSTSASVSMTVNAPGNVAPTVAITAPAPGTAITRGATVAITATAADSDGTVARVEFYDGATLLGTDTTTPYAFSWVTTTATTAGAHSLTARAYDNVGAVTTSAAVSMTVNAPANVAPTVAITAPASGTAITRGATVAITATAADSDGTVARVEFYDGATLLGTDTTAPYAFSWVTTTATATGAHSLTARAYDNVGAVRTSAAVSVTINTVAVPTLVSQGKVTTQSSTDFLGGAERAVDGNTNGIYNNNSVTHTAITNQPWWQVDLGQLYMVNNINVWNRTDSCCTTRLENFVILVSSTDMTGRTLAQLQADATVTKVTVASLNGAANINVQMGNAQGQYVRVQLTGTATVLNLAEVQVFGQQ